LKENSKSQKEKGGFIDRLGELFQNLRFCQAHGPNKEQVKVSGTSGICDARGLLVSTLENANKTGLARIKCTKQFKRQAWPIIAHGRSLLTCFTNSYRCTADTSDRLGCAPLNGGERE
uniref:Uncharacterized protein n=1 Tax=Myripristis murdjan TaxID=586833 RepID=A0A667YFU5_9TELE